MRRLKRLSILRFLALLFVYGLFLGAGALTFAIREFSKDLPERLDKVLDYKARAATIVYSADGEPIGEFFLQERKPVALEKIPPHVQHAFVAAEDRRFYHHVGFDPIGIGRAAYANWRHAGVRQGASTITQQVVRMLLLSNERTLSRKAKEVILAVRVERELTKEQILYIYLNQVYLGHGAYGVQAAAEAYFGKDADQLTLAEAAILAGLPKAPTKFSPYNDFARAKERQAYVLGRMREDGYISAVDEEAARHEPLALLARDQPLAHVAAPYFVEHVRKWASAKYGDELLYGQGLRIYTTIDMNKQRAAEAAVKDGLDSLDRRLGFRGPIGHLEGAERDAFAEGPPRPYVADPSIAGLYAGGALIKGEPYVGVVTELREPTAKKGVQVDLGPRDLRLSDDDARRLLRWHDKKDWRKKITVGDLVPVKIIDDPKKGEILTLAQTPDVQGALVSIDLHTGAVVALVGGYSYAQSQFDRATQARRQAGSSMKPYIYATALQHGYTELSIVQDAPIVIKTASGLWAPHNYKAEFLGPLTLKTALAKSINTVSVRLVAAVGVDPVIKTMRAAGITSPIPHHISIALGTPDLSLLENTAGYAMFPTGGKRVDPKFVNLVTTDGGRILEDDRAVVPTEQVLDSAIAYLMVDLMHGVVLRGTGRGALALGRPCAGKTGTSTGFRDAWFISYTTEMVTGVWVGRDNFKPIGYDATGGVTALPIWLQYMRAAHPDTPPREWAPPPDVTFVRASWTTGSPAAPGAPDSAWVPFARGTVPHEFTSTVDAGRFSTAGGFR